MPPEIQDRFFAVPTQRLRITSVIRCRATLTELQKIDVSKVTGPDMIRVRILQKLSAEIALPPNILCRRILHEAEWPNCWRIHHLMPLFKRGFAFDVNNYRRVHLVSILVKIAERVIAKSLMLNLQLYDFGPSQWAFKKRCSSRDLATLCICR